MSDDPSDETIGSGSTISLVEEEESPVNSSINTTPLVDIMLVLLIIFLITIPVAVQSIKVDLPTERNQVVTPRKENINISVRTDGAVFWNNSEITESQLASRLAVVARETPQPEVHIRGDLATKYFEVGKVVAIAQKSGILKIGFITKAPRPGEG
ncbi:MAG: biopolymer transporter ExbD [Hyphomonadaceae bacterium]